MNKFEKRNEITNYSVSPEDKESTLEGISGDIIWREDIGYLQIVADSIFTPNYISASKINCYDKVCNITNVNIVKVYDYKEDKCTDFAEDNLMNFYDVLYEVVYSVLNKYPHGTHIYSVRGLDIVLKYKNIKPYFEHSNGDKLNLSSFVLSELYFPPVLKIKIKRNDILDKFNCDDFEIVD